MGSLLKRGLATNALHLDFFLSLSDPEKIGCQFRFSHEIQRRTTFRNSLSSTDLKKVHVVEAAITSILEKTVFDDPGSFGSPAQTAFMLGNLGPNTDPLNTIRLF